MTDPTPSETHRRPAAWWRSKRDVFRPRTVFQGLWHGPELGPLRKACIDSFLRNGYDFHLFTYEVVDVPDGVTLRDANEIIPEAEIFYFDNPRSDARDLGPFSDLFRFKLLSERGGWWCDVDTICVSSTIPQSAQAWAEELPEVPGVHVGTSQIALRAHDDLSRALYERCLALSRTAFDPREALGPHLLSAVIAESGLPHNLVGRSETFYPIRWIESFMPWLPEFTEEVTRRVQTAWFVPIYQSFPKYIGLGDSLLPPRGSYLHEACLRFDLTLGLGDCYPHSDVRGHTQAFFRREETWAIPELIAVSGAETAERLGL